MRTTLTLEPDVAALVKKAMKARKASLKEVVNDAIRAALTAPVVGEKEAEYVLPSFRSGGLRVPNLDDVSAALEDAEGPWHR